MGHATPILDKDTLSILLSLDSSTFANPVQMVHWNMANRENTTKTYLVKKHGVECEDDISDDKFVSQGQVLPSHWCNTHNLPHDINYKKYLCQQRAAKQQMQFRTSVTEISCSRGVT